VRAAPAAARARERGPPSASRAAPGRSGAARLAELQRAAGNQAVGRLLARSAPSPAQPALTIGPPGDAYEREADRVADQVMRGQEVPVAAPEAAPPALRRCAACAAGGAPCAECAAREDEEEHAVRRKEAGAGAPSAAPGVAASVRAATAGGAPLAPSLRGFFEPRLGRGLGHVRVHTGAAADDAARAVHARAFTLGGDVVFAAGEYRPESPAGRRLLAHELAHVAQQTAADPPAAAVPGSASAPRVRASGPRIARQPAPDAGEKPFTIPHVSNRTFTVPGLREGATAFGATGATLSQTRAATRKKDRPITGGFAEPLSLEAGFGLRAEASDAAEVRGVIAAAGSRVPAALAGPLAQVARDRFYLCALRSFLEKDGGRFEYPGHGRYDYKSPPTITIGDEGVEKTRSTLFHELLHYVLDRMDAEVAEGVDSGGADHPLILALETRFQIVEMIRSGRPPVDDSVSRTFGEFIKGHDTLPAVRDAIRDNDGPRLLAAVEDPAFVTTAVSGGVLAPAAALEMRKAAGEYVTPPAGFRDLAFIWAQNAVIVRRAMREAVSLSLKLGVPLKDVFGREEWHGRMDAFIRNFVAAVARDPTQDPVALEPGVLATPDAATPAPPAAPPARRQSLGVGAGVLAAGGRPAPLLTAAWQTRFPLGGGRFGVPLGAQLQYAPPAGVLGSATAGIGYRPGALPLNLEVLAGLGGGQVQLPGAAPGETERRGVFGPVGGVGASLDLGRYRFDLRYQRLFDLLPAGKDVETVGLSGSYRF